MSMVIINGIPTEVGQGAGEIIALRKQLADQKAYYEQVMADGGKRISDLMEQNQALRKANLECVDYFNESQKDLAASQAREHLLIHALENHGGNYKLTKAECAEINAVISQSEKQDTSALEALIAEAKSEQSDFDNQQFMEERKRLITAAGEVMRERCREVVFDMSYSDSMAVDVSQTIRAIPGVTLEDLK